MIASDPLRMRRSRAPVSGRLRSMKKRPVASFASMRAAVPFPALFFSNTKVLEYIWANELEPGTIESSPYSDNIKLIVVRSGPTEEGWYDEKRAVYRDYVAAFGAKPKAKIGAVAFMCDSDSTASRAAAIFDDIKIFTEQ